MRDVRFAGSLLLVALLTACTGVYSPTPVGDAPVALVAEEWEGTWTDGENALLMTVTDAEKGEMKLAWIEKDGGELRLEAIKIYLRSAGAWTLVSIADQDYKEGERYLWGRLKKEDEHLLAWPPDTDAFIKLVEEKKLPGKVTDGDVHLEKLSPEQLELIVSGSEGLLFEWDEPLVLVRW